MVFVYVLKSDGWWVTDKSYGLPVTGIAVAREKTTAWAVVGLTWDGKWLLIANSAYAPVGELMAGLRNELEAA